MTVRADTLVSLNLTSAIHSYSENQLARHLHSYLAQVSETIIIPNSAKAESGNIGKGLVCQYVWMPVLVHSSMMAGWIFFILGTMIKYHGLLMHVN